MTKKTGSAKSAKQTAGKRTEKPQKSERQSRDSSGRIASDQIQRLPLNELHFDGANPRFGGQHLENRPESEILDEIVRKYGVVDVLSSIATNGYLETEPLVGIRTKKGVRIIEGNRRLAAMLILTRELRAKNQQRLQKLYQPRVSVDTVPVVVYKEDAKPAQLLPYLGVKHIVGAKEWDSYAKAVWVADVLDDPDIDLNIDTIEEMIGDTTGTMRQALEGYYFVHQLEQDGYFDPKDSDRKGRGSNLDYPFSWIYNAFKYKTIRDWAGLPDDRQPRKNPVPKNKLSQAADLMTWLFGNRSKNQPAAIRDTRELTELATCLAYEDQSRQLQKGLTVKEVKHITRRVPDRLRDSLNDAKATLAEAWDALGQSDLSEEQARESEPVAGQVRKLATNIHGKLLELLSGEE